MLPGFELVLITNENKKVYYRFFTCIDHEVTIIKSAKWFELVLITSKNNLVFYLV